MTTTHYSDDDDFSSISSIEDSIEITTPPDLDKITIQKYQQIPFADDEENVEINWDYYKEKLTNSMEWNWFDLFIERREQSGKMKKSDYQHVIDLIDNMLTHHQNNFTFDEQILIDWAKDDMMKAISDPYYDQHQIPRNGLKIYITYAYPQEILEVIRFIINYQKGRCHTCLIDIQSKNFFIQRMKPNVYKAICPKCSYTFLSVFW